VPSGPGCTKAIEDVAVGDTVWAWDEATGEVSQKRVIRVYRRTADHLRVLRTRSADGRDSQELKTTDEHPFWGEGRGWVRAAELRVGQKVRQADGGYATVTASWREDRPEGVPVFNLETEDLHTYHVAQAGTRAPPLLVHNCNDAGRGTAVRNYKPEQPGFDAGMGKRPAQFRETPPPAELGECTPPGKYAPPGVVRPGTTGNAPAKLAFKTGAEAEAYLAKLYPSGQPQVKFKTGVGTGAQRFRYVDVLDNDIAHESKIGYTKLGDFQEKQIAKDAWLLKNSDVTKVKGVTWHFFRSAVTGEIGASQELLQALENNRIKYVIHN
jgi:hypothetical protein